jgi:cytochrome c556
MLLLGIVAAWLLGGQTNTPLSETASTQRFRAEAGTQRANAKALVHNRKYAPAEEGTSTAPVEVWGRFDDDEPTQPDAEPWHETQRLADEVLDDLQVEDGLAVLKTELQQTDAPSLIYAAMATLYAREEPYDSELVERTFALALSTATSPEERLDVLVRQSKNYMERGQAQAVLDLVARTQPDTAAFSTYSAELDLLKANAQFATGDVPAAISTLVGLIERDDAIEMLEDEEFEAVYRQAAMRLARIYREMGDEHAADNLARAMRSRLRE